MTKKTAKKTASQAKKTAAKKTVVKKAACDAKKAVGKCCGGCKCSKSRKAKTRA